MPPFFIFFLRNVICFLTILQCYWQIRFDDSWRISLVSKNSIILCKLLKCVQMCIQYKVY